MNTYHVYTAHMSPALNRSSALEHFECSDATELLSRIISTWDCHMCIHTYIPTTCIHTYIYTYILHIQHTTYTNTYNMRTWKHTCTDDTCDLRKVMWTSILLVYIIDHSINSCVKKHFKPSSHGGLQTSDAVSTVYAVLSARLNL